MKINNKKIGLNFKPFIVAELSGNHKGSINRALSIIRAAKNSGADAIKIQTYTPDDITLNLKTKDFIINNKHGPWNKKKLYDLYVDAHTPLKWHKKIFQYAKKQKLICFASVFSERRVEFLEKLGCPAYKIASFENNHYPLIEKVLKTKKPVIVSTGMLRLKEIEDLIRFIKKFRKKNFAILKCSSAYPSKFEDVNINSINYLRKKFKNIEIGFSDHTKGISASCAAVALGATIIEKHLILDNKKTVDSSFSITPQELKELVKTSKEIWQSLGKVDFTHGKNEENNKKLKRSIFVIKNIEKGDYFTKENVGIIRPGHGLKTEYFDKILGKISNKKLIKGIPFKLEYLKK